MPGIINHREVQIESTSRYYSVPTRMAEIRDRPSPSAGKNAEEPKPHALLGGMWKGSITLGNSLAVSQKVTRAPLYDPCILLLGIEARETNTCVRTELCAKYHGSFTCNLETIPTSPSRWTHEQIVVYAYSGLLFSTKKKPKQNKTKTEWPFDICSHEDEAQIHYAE